MTPDTEPIAILAVDDEPGVLALVRRCLDDERFTLTEAASGRAALAQIEKGAPLDLLITDLRMPEMEGDELARQVPTPGSRSQGAVSHQPCRPAVRREAAALGRGGVSRQAVLEGRPARSGRAAAVRPDDAVNDAAHRRSGQARHDFKNQLAIIRGFSEILIAEAADGDRAAATSRRFTPRR